MRLTAEEKTEIIRLVVNAPDGVNKSLRSLGIHKRTFYNWYHAYNKDGVDGLRPKRRSKQQWNRIPDEERQLIVNLALEHTDQSPRELAVKITDEQQFYISESSVYRILKARGLIPPAAHVFISAADEFHTKTRFSNEMWQTDFTYFKIKGWGWYYLSTILDDYSRYIVYHELCSTMKSEDVERCVGKAMKQAKIGIKNPPKLLSDNGVLPGSKNTVKMGIGVQQNREQEYSKNGNKNTVISINIINQGLHCIINKKQDCDGLKNKITYHYVSRDSQAS